MSWSPAPREDTFRLATPLLRLALPSEVEPSVNETDPVGVPEELVTVAVKVTVWPDTIEDRLLASPVVVAMLNTSRPSSVSRDSFTPGLGPGLRLRRLLVWWNHLLASRERRNMEQLLIRALFPEREKSVRG